MHDYHLLSTSIFSLHPPTLLQTTSLLFGFMKSCLIVLCLQRFNTIKREPDENSCAAAVLYQGYPGSPCYFIIFKASVRISDDRDFSEASRNYFTFCYISHAFPLSSFFSPPLMSSPLSTLSPSLCSVCCAERASLWSPYLSHFDLSSQTMAC